MNKNLMTLAASLCAACLLSSCYATSRMSGDAAEDADEDPLHDPAVDDARDSADTLEDEDLPPQGSITFVIRNSSSETRYLEWSTGGYTVVEGARTTGGAWDPLYYWSPGCMLGCFATEPGYDCCVMCEPMMPAVKELYPGDEVRISWDGRVVYQVDEDYCQCSCYWERPPVPMAYRASACDYDALSCYTPPCNPDENGVFWNALPSGGEWCSETIFDIPYPGDEVVIEINL